MMAMYVITEMSTEVSLNRMGPKLIYLWCKHQHYPCPQAPSPDRLLHG